MSKRISALFLAIALWMLAIFLLVRLAHADTLQPVQTPPDYAFWTVAIVASLLAAGCVYLWRHHPGAVAKAKEAGQAAASEAEALKAGLSTMLGQLITVVQDLGAHVKALTPAPGPAQEAPTLTEAVAVPPAGKKGQAGLLSVHVGGADFQADLAAFMSAYNA